MRRNDPKNELTPKALENCKKQIWQMPYLDRVNILALSIVGKEREAFAAVNGLIALVSRMSKEYSVAKRLMVAEAMRTAADIMDHELQSNEDASVMLRE
jgi:hypothetical protein